MLGQGGKREVATLAWPLAVGLLSYTVMGVVDTLLMGRVGTAAQAGVGLATVVVFGLMAFFRGLISGAQSVVAAADGAGDAERVARGASAALVIAAASGLLATLALLLVRAFALEPMANDAEVAAAAAAYLDAYLPFLPVALLGHGAIGALQGKGDTRIRMWASFAGNAVNVVLDLVLIFGAGPFEPMGAKGAGLATGAGTAVMLALYLARYLKRFGRPRVPGWAVLRSSFTVGLPAGVQYVSGALSWSVMNIAVARVGPEHLAANQIVINVISVSFLPGYGLGEASGILVGRYLGSGKPRTAARAVRPARALSLWVMGSCGLVFALAGGPIARIFSQDPAVVALATQLLLFAAAFQLLDAVAMTHLCALRGAGDTRFTLALTSVSSWLVMVPTAVLLGAVAGWGAPGAWLGLTLEITFLAGLTGWRVGGLRTGRVGRLEVLLGRKAPA